MDGDGTDAEQVLDRQLAAAVRMNLFDEQPPYLNAFFRFQLGSNTFDGEPVASRASWSHSLPRESASHSLLQCIDRQIPRSAPANWRRPLLTVGRVIERARSTGLAPWEFEFPFLAGYEFAMEAWKRVASVGATAVGNGAMHAGGEEQVRRPLELPLGNGRAVGQDRPSFRCGGP